MITTLPYLPTPPGHETHTGIWEQLSEAQRERVLDLADSLTAILSPLAQITSRPSLEDSLHSRVSYFAQLSLELQELLWPTLEGIKGQVSSQHDAVRELILGKLDLLGKESAKRLLGAIDSNKGLNQWVISASEGSPREIYRLMFKAQQAGESALYAAMCINTLIEALTDRITDWQPEAIPTLAAAADDYMAEVEDIFLAQTAGGQENGPEETVGFDSLRKELGL